MAKNTITSADSTFVLSVAGLYGAGVSIEGYAADAAFAIGSAEMAEVVMGVDSKMSAGWVPRIYEQTITLQADSASILVFDAIAQAQDVAKTVYWLSGVISLPGTRRAYALSNGILRNYTVMPAAQKVLQPVEFTIAWESIKPAVI